MIDPAMERLLSHMVQIDASDLYLTVGAPPVFRVAGTGHAGRVPLTPEQVAAMAASLMTPEQQGEFARALEMNLAIALEGRGRFRINVFRQRGAVGLVARLVRTSIRTLDELGLPTVLKDVALSARGLVLVAGATGSGKSTTLAAMIDHRNQTESGHIVTIEDPVEFIHEHKKCVVTQREVGLDTLSYGDALKNTLRQAPDVILIGEIRNVETMEAAVAFAETGHLCISTLHANNANQAIERILNFFPADRQREICLQLSLNLRAIVSQRLVKSHEGGRAAALEILLDAPRIRDLIKRGEIEALKDAMEQNAAMGCRTFDAALYDLVAQGRIEEAEALRAADSANNLRLRLERLRQSGGGPAAEEQEAPLRLRPEGEFEAPPRTAAGPRPPKPGLRTQIGPGGGVAAPASRQTARS